MCSAFVFAFLFPPLVPFIIGKGSLANVLLIIIATSMGWGPGCLLALCLIFKAIAEKQQENEKQKLTTPEDNNISADTSADINRNPILNSPDDITDNLIERILNNDLDSLTINYDFTRCAREDEEKDEWYKEQLTTNPFLRANTRSPKKNKF